MLSVAVVGIGFIGRVHVEQYIRLMSEGVPVKLVALCDIDKKKLTSEAVGGNLGDLGQSQIDVNQFNLYTDFDEMITAEKLDFVDITLPTYLHSYYSIKAMNAGLHVLCEKPMAINSLQCQMMIDASKRNNVNLMIAQCLRFWPAYETLKHIVETKKLGKPVCCYFYRGGSTPIWSYQNWLLDEVLSGGCLLDQHVHDVDIVNWLFGTPKAVSTIAVNVISGAGFDALSTNYRYEGFVVNSQDDWTQNGDGAPFKMLFRANFERGLVTFMDGVTTVYPLDGKMFVAEDCGDNGYYREIKYFIEAIINNTPIEISSTESTMRTIEIAHAERESARNDGEWVQVR